MDVREGRDSTSSETQELSRFAVCDNNICISCQLCDGVPRVTLQRVSPAVPEGPSFSILASEGGLDCCSAVCADESSVFSGVVSGTGVSLVSTIFASAILVGATGIKREVDNATQPLCVRVAYAHGQDSPSFFFWSH